MTQKICERLGAEGCYFLSILELAKMITGKKFNPVDLYQFYNNIKIIEEDCFVNDPSQLLSSLIGKKVSVTKEKEDYLPLANEYEILRYEWKTTRGLLAHFVLGDGKGNVLFDPLGESNTVKNGKLASKRIFRV